MPKKAKVTTRDIAARCGISQTTVSMILSEKEGISFSKDTIEKVKNTAESMGYHYKKKVPREENLSARTILVLVPSMSSQYYTMIISAVTEYAARKELNISICLTMREKEREEYYLRMCEQSGFYGIICTYPPQAVDSINTFYKKHPFVLMSDYNPALKVGLAELDSYKSGELIAEHLLGLGHKEVAYMTTPLNRNEIPRIRRMEGIQAAYKKAGYEENSVHVLSLTDYQWKNYCMGNRYYDAGQLLTERYLAAPSKVTAFIGNNDIIAIGVIDCLRKHGFKIPDDYSVCGFDNTLPASYSGISLTSIDHCIEEKGKDAVNMLASQKAFLGGMTPKKASPFLPVTYEPQLFIRNSTGKAKVEK